MSSQSDWVRARNCPWKFRGALHKRPALLMQPFTVHEIIYSLLLHSVINSPHKSRLIEDLRQGCKDRSHT